MIVRHDIDPQLYLVDPAQFPAVVAVVSCQEEVPVAYDNIDRMLKPSLVSESQMMPEICDRTDGMGSLIAPRWILTAAHVAAEIAIANEIELASEIYTVEQVVIHPDFRNGSTTNEYATNDIALLKLDRSVKDVEPLLLYRQLDELGKTVTFVGSGDFGNGLIGPDSVDAKLRMATNCVELADRDWLTFRFDAPPDTTALEGISGPGDRGGPALLRMGERWAIAGISAGQDSRQLGEGYYGALEYYTRVSQHLNWIEFALNPSSH